jgi:hypothetical protein
MLREAEIACTALALEEVHDWRAAVALGLNIRTIERVQAWRAIWAE